jgi:arylformamidase
LNNIDKKEDQNNNSITISRAFNDLTHLISQDMPVYPGELRPEFKPYATIENEKINVTRIVIGSHTGTHVDAQKHFFADGIGVDKEPLANFIGEAIILDLSNMNIGSGITGSDLDKHSEMVKCNDILLLYTATSDKWRKDEIIRYNFTYLEPTAADWLRYSIMYS